MTSQKTKPYRRAVAFAALWCALGAAAVAAAPRSFARGAQPLLRIERVELAGFDALALRESEAALEGLGLPSRFAEPIAVSLSTDNSGTWEQLADGSWLWRLRVGSPGALSLNLAFSRFDLPPGAKLWLYDPNRELVRGPYTRQGRGKRGRFYTPIVEGDEVVVELAVPAAQQRRVKLELSAVNFGFQQFGPGAAKQGDCNIDVVCPEGDRWRDQIRSVGVYTLQGQWNCTGTLFNNTSGDLRPYFYTAHHCGVTVNNDDTVVVYWNFQSARCGDLSGGSLAQSQTGATFRATHRETDFTLLELNQRPSSAFNVYYAGWDATGTRPASTVVIHHPNTDEKAISFDNNQPSDSGNILIGGTALTHWRVNNYERGTTEPGSSGSCLFDEASRLCIGDLTGGDASCSLTQGYDVFGKLAASWDGGGAASSRLRDWLDPATGGTRRTLTGTNPGGQPGSCATDADTLCLLAGRYEARVTWSNPGDGSSGTGKAIRFTDYSGGFYFLDPTNPELLLKVLELGGIVKVFYGQLTNLPFTVTLRETATGRIKTYRNTAGECGAIDQNYNGLASGVLIAEKSADPPQPLAAPCSPSNNRLCLLNRRISVEVSWRNHLNNQFGLAGATPFGGEFSGLFHYTDPSNVELLTKALDFNGRILFFWGALSDLEYTITVTDTVTNKVKTYFNPGGRFCGGRDDDFNGGGGGGGGGTNLTEIEPNDTPDQAQRLTGSSPIRLTGSLQTSDVGTVDVTFNSGARDDLEDLYRLVVTGTGLTATLSGLSADGDLYLISGNLNTVLEQSNDAGTGDESISLPNLQPGTYYLGVSIYDPDPIQSSTNYVLTLTGSL